jgi:catechol 2,3-dioxygenase-like lactoylglutathione lyase family enzyme
MTSLPYGPQQATVLAMTATSINHVSLHADDLDTSVAFYEQLFAMQRIAAPTFAFPVAWLRLGRQQLHLFVRDDVRAPRFHHVGLNVDDFEAVYWRAREHRLHDESAFFSGMYELPDGSVQMYLRDPADNLVEIDWPDVGALDARIREQVIALSSTVPQTGDASSATLYLDRRDGGVDEVAACRRCGAEMDTPNSTTSTRWTTD